MNMPNSYRYFSFLTAIIGSAVSYQTAYAQDVLGTNVGIPNGSPGVLWPKGMSIESLSPINLYPNGGQFGLSNTSGGLGTSGSGPATGVGLAQRSVSPLVQQELERPDSEIRRLSAAQSAEVLRSQNLLSGVLSSQYKAQLSSQARATSDITFTKPNLPAVDAILQDRPATTDSVLKTDQ